MSATIGAALERGRDALRAVPGGVNDAGILLAFALGVDRGQLITMLQDPLPAQAALAFDAALSRRIAREPVSHILTYRDFYGLRFTVNRHVLDPRPETEMLVQAALERPFASVLDLGTGSGCILLSLLAERAGATGTGTDLSPAALRVAADNAAALGLTARSQLIQSDWFAGVEGRFDLIVSNPPYIANMEMNGLAPEVRDWEPHLALTPGGDGLDAYRAIAGGAKAHLTPGGWLMVEIGSAQGDAVSTLFAAAGLVGIAVLPDLDRRDRVVVAQAT